MASIILSLPSPQNQEDQEIFLRLIALSIVRPKKN